MHIRVILILMLIWEFQFLHGFKLFHFVQKTKAVLKSVDKMEQLETMYVEVEKIKFSE